MLNFIYLVKIFIVFLVKVSIRFAVVNKNLYNKMPQDGIPFCGKIILYVLAALSFSMSPSLFSSLNFRRRLSVTRAMNSELVGLPLPTLMV